MIEIAMGLVLALVLLVLLPFLLVGALAVFAFLAVLAAVGYAAIKLPAALLTANAQA